MATGTSPQRYSWRHWRTSEQLVQQPAWLSAPMRQSPLYVQLRDYQKVVVKFALSQPGVGLFCDPRTGKTWIALGIVDQLLPDEALFVIPLTNKFTTWVKLAEQLLPDYAVFISWPEYKKHKGKKILIVHYELLRSIIKYVKKRPWGVVVSDESQRIKKRSSKQSRNLKMLRHAKHRIALSGTPVDKGEIDLWAQMRFIEPNAFGERWADFDAEFLRPTGFRGFKREFIEKKHEEFFRRIYPYCLRVTSTEAGFQLPNIIDCPVMIFGEQARIYETISRKNFVDLDGVRIMAEMEITLRVKQQQIVNGFVFDEDGGVHLTGEAKLRKLRYLLRHKITRPAVIFFQFLPEGDLIEEVCKEFSSNVRKLVGAVKDTPKEKRRTNLLNDFQAGKIDYLLCQQKTGGVGIDLYRARNAIMYSFNHSYIDFRQANSRLDEKNQNSSDIFLIYVKATIDEDKYNAIQSKRSLSETILTRLKKEDKMADTKSKTAPKSDKSKVAPKVAAKETKAAPAKADKKADKAKSNLPKRPEYQFNVNTLADDLGIQTASVRVGLRKHGVAKAEGNVYGWDNKKDYEKVIATLSAKEKVAA